jgi:uncharacterized protein YwqG
MKEKLLALIEKEIPSPNREALSKLIRPCIRVETKRNSGVGLPVGVSKMGGLPDLPANVDWPYSPEDKEAYRFVAQFDLAQLSPFDEEHLLPARGMIYFFVTTKWDGKVLYSDAPHNSLEKRMFPDPPTLPRQGFLQKIFSSKQEKKVYEECVVDFKVEYRVPSGDSFYLNIACKEMGNKIFPVGADHENFMEEICDICRIGDNVTDHHFLGYAHGIQGSFQELNAAGVDWKELKDMSLDRMKALTQWRLLFQLDTDPNADFMCGDGGRFYFLIQDNDLRQGNLDQVKTSFDCY